MKVEMDTLTAAELEKIRPELAKAFRDEGAASVNVDEIKTTAATTATKAEREKADAEIATAKSASASEERKRISAIQDSMIAGCEALATTAIADGSTPEAFAVAQIAHLKKNGGSIAAKNSMQTAEEIAKGVGANPTADGNKETLSPKAQAAADLKAMQARGIML